MSDNPTMTLGGRDIPIRLPTLQSVRMDVEIELRKRRNEHRIFAALVGLCWGGRRAPAVSYAAEGYDVQAYGGRIYDALLERGIAGHEIIEAGARCLRVLEGLPLDVADDDTDEPADTAQEVMATTDFSEAGATSI